MRKIIILTLLVVGSYFSLLAQTTEVTLQPGIEGIDATITSYSPDVNYAEYPNFTAFKWTVSGTPVALRSLLKFDLSAIPAGAYITEAKLSLFFAFYIESGEHCTEDGPNDTYLSRVTTDWDEHAVTWNNQPAVTTENQVILPSSIDYQQDYENIDVTSLIRDMRTNDNYGFLIRLVNESHYRRLVFGSSDHTDANVHPKIVLKYTMNAGTEPAQPTNLNVAETSPLNIDLSWEDNASDETSYIIEKSVGTNTNFQEIETLPANSTSTTINENIVNKTKYYFRVKAENVDGYYNYSDEISIITGGISIADGDTTICGKYFFDSGINYPYVSYENYTQTISPENPDKNLKIQFNSFNLSYGDKLYVYDGNSTASPLLKTLIRGDEPDSIVATNDNGTFTFRFTSYDDIYKEEGWEAYISCIDPVSPPYNLTLEASSSDSVKFSWTDTTSNEIAFEIQKSLDGSSFSELTTLNANTLEYVDRSEIYSGADYYYRIKAISTEGYSGWSDTLHVVTPGPAAPSNLLLNSLDNTTNNLEWTDNSDNETAFIIERSLASNSGFSKLAEVGSNITTYDDETAEFDSIYFYRVRAIAGIDSSNYAATQSVLTGSVVFNDQDITRCNYYLLDPGGLNDYTYNEDKTITLYPVSGSIKLKFEEFRVHNNYDFLYVYNGNSASAPLLATLTGYNLPDSLNATSIDGAITLKFTSNYWANYEGFKIHVTCVDIPAKPTGFVATDKTSKEVTLAWNDTYTDEVGFDIFRSTELDGNYANIAALGIDVTQYTDTDLNTGTNYYYKLRVRTNEAYSEFSDTVEIKTLGPSAPSNLNISSDTQTSMHLTWTDNADNEDKFIIERSLQVNSGYEVLDSLEANEVEYTDTVIDFDQVYYYRLYAVANADTSDYISNYFLSGSFVMTNDTTLVRCGYHLLDPGGAVTNYSNGLNETMVLKPESDVYSVKLDFKEFSLENNYDKLYVYDGLTTSDPLIATLTAYDIPESIIASNPDGALTLKMTTDGSGTRDGFKIEVKCIHIPNAPSDLNLIDAGRNTVQFGWTDNSEYEDAQIIYRALNEFGPFNVIDTVQTDVVEYTDSSVNTGTDYYYVLKARTGEGLSEFSDTLSATTTGLTLPTGFSAKATDRDKVQLEWTDESDNEDGFEIRRSLTKDSGFEKITITSADEVSYLDEGLSFDTQYFYKIRAITATDSSNYTEVDSIRAGYIEIFDGSLSNCDYYILDPGGFDNYPENQLVIMNLYPVVSDEKVKLVFNSSELEEGSDYLYIYDGSSITDPLIATLTGNSEKDSVYATNAEGVLSLKFVSNASVNEAGFELHATCVQGIVAPSDLAVVENYSDSLQIQWTDNSDMETGYEIQRSTNSIDFETVGTTEMNETSFMDEFSILSGGTYYYRIKTLAVDGYSPWSDTLQYTDPGPLAPSNLIARSNENTSVHLSWTDNANNEDMYVIERSTEELSGFVYIDSVDTDITEFTDTSLEFDNIYYYRLYAVTNTDTSEFLSTSCLTGSFIMQDDTTLSRCDYYLLDPGGTEDYANGLNEVMVLQPESGINSMQLVFEEFNLETNYDKLYVYDGLTTSDPLIATLTGSSLPDSIHATNLSGALTLKMRSDGSVARSGFKIRVKCIYIPEAPSDLTITDSGRHNATLTWTDNSDYEDGFIIYRSLTENGSYTPVDTVLENITTFTDNSLNTGTSYYYYVKAVSENLLSASSNVGQVSTTGLIVPVDLAVKSTGRSIIELEWTDNLTNETGFEIVRSIDSLSGYDLITSVEANSTAYVDEGLEFDTEYFYKIRAISADDSSDFSEIRSAKAGHINFHTGYIQECGYYLYDTEGERDYLNNQDMTMTLFPSSGNKVKLVLESFNLEENFDSLIVYDGSYFDAPILKAFTGNLPKDSISALNMEGSLKLRFVSDGSVNDSGFKIYVTCVEGIAAPSNLSLVDANSDNIEIEWTDNSDNEVAFQIYRAHTSIGDFYLMALVGANVSSYSDSNVDPGTDYQYIVRALSNEVFSPFSDTLSVSTLVGIGDNDFSEENYRIYPNPTKRNVEVILNNAYKGDIQVKLYSLSGQLIFNKKYKKSTDEFTQSLGLGDLVSGVYLLRIQCTEEKYNIKELIIKE